MPHETRGPRGVNVKISGDFLGDIAKQKKEKAIAEQERLDKTAEAATKWLDKFVEKHPGQITTTGEYNQALDEYMRTGKPPVGISRSEVVEPVNGDLRRVPVQGPETQEGERPAAFDPFEFAGQQEMVPTAFVDAAQGIVRQGPALPKGAKTFTVPQNGKGGGIGNVINIGGSEIQRKDYEKLKAIIKNKKFVSFTSSKQFPI